MKQRTGRLNSILKEGLILAITFPVALAGACLMNEFGTRYIVQPYLNEIRDEMKQEELRRKYEPPREDKLREREPVYIGA